MSDAQRDELEIRLADVMRETARLALDAQHDPFEAAVLGIRADALRRRIGALRRHSDQVEYVVVRSSGGTLVLSGG
jgi:hypothetical protein